MTKRKKDERPGAIESSEHEPSTRKLAPRAASPMTERSGYGEVPWMIGLYIAHSSDTITTFVENGLTIGRHGLDSFTDPHIDLTPQNAQELGVSRVHARLSARKNTLCIHDLGSTNGTYLNGYQIEPFTEVPLHDGDVIELGDMKLRVAFLSRLME